MTKRSVRGLGAALGMSAAVGLSGCAVYSPVQTQEPYQPADGVALNLGSIRIDNLLVVAPTKGGPGVVSASVVNSTGQTVALSFTDATSKSSAQVSIPAYAATTISTPDTRIQLADVSAAPGSNITMMVTSATTGTAQLAVPVLATQAFYQDLQPTAMPTTSTPAPTASATASATPSS